MDWQELRNTDKNELFSSLEEHVDKYPSSVELMENLVSYLRWKRFDKIKTALISEENYNQVNTYCSALDFVAGRLKTLIEKGKKRHDGL